MPAFAAYRKKFSNFAVISLFVLSKVLSLIFPAFLSSWLTALNAIVTNVASETAVLDDSRHEIFCKLLGFAKLNEELKAGEQAVLAATPFGRIGLTVCYDLRFPQLYRALAQGGAEMLTCPAAFTKKTGEAHWHVLNRARAIENTSFMIAPCSVGPVPGGGEAYGHSLIIDPWGEVLADGGTGHGVVSAVIDLDKVDQARGRIPSLTHDREFTFAPDLKDMSA